MLFRKADDESLTLATGPASVTQPQVVEIEVSSNGHTFLVEKGVAFFPVVIPETMGLASTMSYSTFFATFREYPRVALMISWKTRIHSMKASYNEKRAASS